MHETMGANAMPRGKIGRRYVAWLSLSLLVIMLDQASKWVMLQTLALGEVIPVTGFFKLVRVFNPGAAFSFLADHSGWQRWFFIGLAVVVCGWLLAMLREHVHERLMPIALTMIVGGAVGNVIDRLVHGAVVDFLYFHYEQYGWPAFNLADSAISLGVALMLFAQFRTPSAQESKP